MSSKRHKIIIAYLCFTILFVLSCNSISKPKSNQDDWDRKNIHDLTTDDTAFLFAVKTAQENIGLFIKLINAKKDNGFVFYIKSKFTDGNHVEHMWSVVKNIHEDSFEATIDNVPKNLTTVKYKQVVSVQKKSVEDWIIYDKDSVILGNFIQNKLHE